MPNELNWWTGLIFALGSALFAAASVLAIAARPGQLESLDSNVIFFAGSIPFTAAAYLQFFQAANAADSARRTPRSRNIGEHMFTLLEGTTGKPSQIAPERKAGRWTRADGEGRGVNAENTCIALEAQSRVRA
jgi:hypothetical protein